MHRAPVVAALGVVAFASTASAAPLNLLLAPSPDIFSSFISVNYNPALSKLQLTASGFPLELFDGSSLLDIDGGAFQLDITVDTAGNASDGQLSIRGAVDDGDPSTGEMGNPVSLLRGNLKAFGWEMGSETLEFIFEVSDGALASDYGAHAGVLLADSGFGGDWTQSFSTTNAVADTAPPVPAPGVLACAGIGLGLIGTRRRR